MSKYALLVGIGDYPKGRWKSPGHASENIGMMKAILSRFEFPEENTLILSSDVEPLPTARNIVDGFEKHLIQQGKAGDIAIFYYYGHGAQVPSADEEETDGCDEALVPYDADQPEEWTNYLLDDDLFFLIQQLVQKQVHATVIMESCHSGTSVRALGDTERPQLCRGRDVAPFPVKPFLERGEHVRRSAKATGSKWLPEGNYVLLAACADDQLNWLYHQGGDVGRLTWCLNQELNPDALARTVPTYRQLFENLQRRFMEISNGANQVPQLEGTGGVRDWLVFGGDPLPPAQYIRVTDHLNSAVHLAAGFAHGLTVGSELAIFPNHVNHESETVEHERLGKATVKKVYATTSSAELTERNPDNAAELAGAHAFLLSRGKSDFQMPVALEAHLPRQNEIADAVRRSPLLLLAEEEGKQPEVEIGFSRERSNYILTFEDGAVELPYVRPTGKFTSQPFRKVLEQIARRRNLLEGMETVKPPDSLLEGKIQLGLRRLGEGDVPAEELGRVTELRMGDRVQLEIANRSDADLYCSVFGCSPSPYWEIRQIFPWAEGAADNRLSPREAPHVIGQFEVAPPPGTTVIKLIATQKFSDLNQWAQPKLSEVEIRQLRSIGGQTGFFTSLWHGAPLGTAFRLLRREDWTTDTLFISVAG